MFENDERFHAVERPRDREDLFESYLVDLQKKVRACGFFWTKQLDIICFLCFVADISWCYYSDVKSSSKPFIDMKYFYCLHKA